MISTEREKWEVTEQIHPNDFFANIFTEMSSQLKCQSSRSLFHMLKWLNKLHRRKMTFLHTIHGVPGQQPTPGGDRAVAVCHPWAISPCMEEERGDAAFCLHQELFELFTMDGRTTQGRGWGGWCNAIDIDPARKNNNLTCSMSGGLANVEGRPYSSVIFTV